jgi:hypothetical protein
MTATFRARLDEIGAFLDDAGAPTAFDALLATLSDTVIPNLERFPRIGRRYREQLPQSVEAIEFVRSMRPGAFDALRVYLHGDYLLLYADAPAEGSVYLLSIRHHRELSFDLPRIWPAG